jgi:hypothetical protein
VTAITRSNKNICVPDACSLIFSGQIELGGKEIFEWLLERYDIYIGPQVKEECFRTINREKTELINAQKFNNHVTQRTISEIDHGRCLEYLIDFCDKNDVSEFSKQHPGEMECLALSLYLNARLAKPIILLTDDFPAIKAFAKLIEDQKFAIQMCVPDIIISIFKTELDINENETRASLLTYYNIMKQAMRKEIYKRRFKESCKNVWYEKCAALCVIKSI